MAYEFTLYAHYFYRQYGGAYLQEIIIRVILLTTLELVDHLLYLFGAFFVEFFLIGCKLL